jgi:hypothetical protein
MQKGSSDRFKMSWFLCSCISKLLEARDIVASLGYTAASTSRLDQSSQGGSLCKTCSCVAHGTKGSEIYCTRQYSSPADAQQTVSFSVHNMVQLTGNIINHRLDTFNYANSYVLQVYKWVLSFVTTNMLCYGVTKIYYIQPLITNIILKCLN